MIVLTTGQPTATVEGQQIALAIPSGNSEVTIALTFAQARHLAETTIRTVNMAIDAANREGAEIIPLRKARRA